MSALTALQLLWRGEEAMQAALAALEAAQVHAEAGQRISWAQPFMRPATKPKEAEDFGKLKRPSAVAPVCPDVSPEHDRARSHGQASTSSGQSEARHSSCTPAQQTSIRAVSWEEAAAAVPGLISRVPAWSAEGSGSAALWIEGSHVIHPTRYLEGLWRACKGLALQHGADVQLHRQPVASLTELEGSRGPYSAVIVAAGAASGALSEIGGELFGRCTLCCGSQMHARICSPPSTCVLAASSWRLHKDQALAGR